MFDSGKMSAAAIKKMPEEDPGTVRLRGFNSAPPVGSCVARMLDVHAELFERQFGVVTSVDRLGHRSRASCERPASKIADFTCALGTGNV